MTSTPLPAHPAFAAGSAAVITGGANGIGLAVAQKLTAGGMKVMLADRDSDALNAAAQSFGADATVKTHLCDVSSAADMHALRDAADAAFGNISVLTNNAGAGLNPGKPWENPDGWQQLLDINLGGIINGVQAFVPGMIASGAPGIVINTGSKQGITLPPGNSAYNVSKAGVKAFTEMLAHELRSLDGCQITAHLLIPGFTFTGMIRRFIAEKPPAAWTSEQVADFLFESIARGDFYILCPDNDVTRDMDEKRIAWTAGDMIENRPALSRWHADFTAAFDAFMKDAPE